MFKCLKQSLHSNYQGTGQTDRQKHTRTQPFIVQDTHTDINSNLIPTQDPRQRQDDRRSVGSNVYLDVLSIGMTQQGIQKVSVTALLSSLPVKTKALAELRVVPVPSVSVQWKYFPRTQFQSNDASCLTNLVVNWVICQSSLSAGSRNGGERAEIHSTHAFL